MKLYSTGLSGHAHRARLFLSLLELPYELVEVDLASREQKAPAFLALNPFGQVPVLQDGTTVVPDSNAILVYLARKSGRTDWLPEDPAGAARVQRWLSVAAGQIAAGPAAARLITVFGAPYRPEEVIPRAHAILTLIEAELGSAEWIAADRATIADIALYSYIAAAPEGNVDLSPYPGIRAWLKRIEALSGFVALPRTAAGLHAAA
ncbi:glutathione S-transferase family protein [Pararoseomonas indoligenes]|uniref:Glutathione S-transferase n=1 Tax=Roseomonas indoligenes TaxID=2820811 RepID=A0A940S742_9PROT|nr:glutathione S-transferase [Pararoseomonas indoligenes]MBP0492658.1 glutathione S-transferase [Pararoseomonas indoligenes]